MYCKKCGKKLNDTDKFCYSCGYKVQCNISEHNNPSIDSITKNKGNKNHKFTKRKILIGIVVLLLIIINPLSWFDTSNDYKKVIDAYVKAMMSGNAQKTVNLIHDDYIDVFIDSGAFSSKSEIIKYMQENLDDTMERMDDTYGKGWHYDYYVTDTYSYSLEDVDLILSYIGYEFADVYYTADEVMKVVMNVTRYGSKYTDSSTVSVILLNIGGKWYTTMETY